MNKIGSALLGVAVMLGAAAGIAQAGDRGSLKDSAYATPFSWDGAYLGLQAGYSWSDARFEFDNYMSEPNPDGFTVGAYLGYSIQRDRLVFGIDADIAYAGMSGTDGQRYLSDPSIAIAGVDVDMELKFSGAVRARLGYAAGRFLPYIAGGIAFSRYELRIEDHVNGTVPFERHANLVGWTLGAGFEYAATERMIIRAEYRYTDYGKDSFPNDTLGPHAFLEMQTHDVRLGLAYKF